MNDLISRQAAIDTVAKHFRIDNDLLEVIVYEMERLPPAQPDDRLAKIADILEGTIDHFDLEDAMDVLYQIKDVLR